MKFKVLCCLLCSGIVFAQIPGSSPAPSGTVDRFALIEGHSLGDGTAVRRMYRIDKWTGNVWVEVNVESGGTNLPYWYRILEMDNPIVQDKIAAAERESERKKGVPADREMRRDPVPKAKPVR